MALPALNLASAQEGAKPDAIGASERELFEMVYRSMRSLAGAQAADFDDLVQSAAEQVTRSLPRFDRRSELKTWVYAVCYRVLLRQRRWYRRWAARFSLGLEQHDFASHAPLQSQLLEGREEARQLRVVLDRVSEKYRTVIILHDIEERSVAEIAEIVEASQLTVRSRLRDGRKQLSKLVHASSDHDWMQR